MAYATQASSPHREKGTGLDGFLQREWMHECHIRERAGTGFGALRDL